MGANPEGAAVCLQHLISSVTGTYDTITTNYTEQLRPYVRRRDGYLFDRLLFLGSNKVVLECVFNSKAAGLDVAMFTRDWFPLCGFSCRIVYLEVLFTPAVSGQACYWEPIGPCTALPAASMVSSPRPSRPSSPHSFTPVSTSSPASSKNISRHSSPTRLGSATSSPQRSRQPTENALTTITVTQPEGNAVEYPAGNKKGVQESSSSSVRRALTISVASSVSEAEGFASEAAAAVELDQSLPPTPVAKSTPTPPTPCTPSAAAAAKSKVKSSAVHRTQIDDVEDASDDVEEICMLSSTFSSPIHATTRAICPLDCSLPNSPPSPGNRAALVEALLSPLPSPPFALVSGLTVPTPPRSGRRRTPNGSPHKSSRLSPNRSACSSPTRFALSPSPRSPSSSSWEKNDARENGSRGGSKDPTRAAADGDGSCPLDQTAEEEVDEVPAEDVVRIELTIALKNIAALPPAASLSASSPSSSSSSSSSSRSKAQAKVTEKTPTALPQQHAVVALFLFETQEGLPLDQTPVYFYDRTDVVLCKQMQVSFEKPFTLDLCVDDLAEFGIARKVLAGGKQFFYKLASPKTTDSGANEKNKPADDFLLVLSAYETFIEPRLAESDTDLELLNDMRLGTVTVSLPFLLTHLQTVHAFPLSHHTNAAAQARMQASETALLISCSCTCLAEIMVRENNNNNNNNDDNNDDSENVFEGNDMHTPPKPRPTQKQKHNSIVEVENEENAYDNEDFDLDGVDFTPDDSSSVVPAVSKLLPPLKDGIFVHAELLLGEKVNNATGPTAAAVVKGTTSDVLILSALSAEELANYDKDDDMDLALDI